MIRSLDEVRDWASGGPRLRLAVAAALSSTALKAALDAARQGMVEPVLVGPAAALEEELRRLDGRSARGPEVIDVADPAEAAARAVGLVRDGDADLLLKGNVPTGALLREVLHRERGLRTGRLLSDVFVFDFPRGEERRLVGITDGGINPAPGLEEKVEIARNAVEAFHALGYPEPKVALLSAVETVTEDLPSTVDAAEMARLWAEGEIEGCILDGPMAMDLAVSPEAARMKGFESPVAGRADILLCPTIEAANIAAKAVNHLVPLEPGHVIVGARAPILIPSRSESARAKVNAVALGCVMATAGG